MHTANDVIMPVLGMNQDSGKIVRWLIREGQPVKKGDPLLEVETDKAVAEIEAPASGILSGVKAQDGDEVPVGTLIAFISNTTQAAGVMPASQPILPASPIALRMAAEHKIDLAQVQSKGKRVEKADVLAYLQSQPQANAARPIRPLASPKARQMAAELGLDLSSLRGSGPDGAVVASDIPMRTSAALEQAEEPTGSAQTSLVSSTTSEAAPTELSPSAVWRIMAERTTAAWKEAPHFFLLREVDATRLMQWKESVQKGSTVKITYTDLLVKITATALRKYPRINSKYKDEKILLLPEINIGIASAVEDGLVVPVIHNVDGLSVSQIATTRAALLEKARAGKLRPEDISGGTFTISNLGMYGVDAFLAVLNSPQSAIMAVGRIVERVVPVNGQIVIRPMISLSLSFDHRSVDGARGAQFLDSLASLIEEPLGLIS
jgi:pyruvate dehydrogenase E2 component (dihydrolipoamide acetyltransferase)